MLLLSFPLSLASHCCRESKGLRYLCGLLFTLSLSAQFLRPRAPFLPDNPENMEVATGMPGSMDSCFHSTRATEASGGRARVDLVLLDLGRVGG